MTITNRVSLKSVMAGVTPINDVPDAPTIGAATNVGTSRAFNNGSATVAYTAAATGGPVTTFTATSTPGGFTATGASPITVTGLQSATSYTFAVSAANANGTLTSAASSSITATTVPQAPTIGTATASVGAASVTFTAGATGGAAVSTYTVTSSPGSLTGTGASSPITVSGLTGGTAYTFTVTATNANGTSAASSASNSVTPPIPNAVVIADYSSPGIRGYAFTGGWGSAYSNPASAVTGQYNDTAFFSADKTTVGTVGHTSPNAYAFTIAGGFGTKYTNPTGGGNNYTWGGFANSNRYYTFSNNAGTLNAWPFTVGTGFGTKYTDPTAPASQYYGDININGTMAVISGATTFIHAWPFSAGFGSKYANPATMPDRTVGYFKPNPAGTAIVGTQDTDNPQDNRPLIAYAFSSGFGTKYANVIPGTYPSRINWSPNGAIVAALGNGSTTNGFALYAFSGGFGTKYTNPANFPTTQNASVWGVAWTANQDTIAFGCRVGGGGYQTIAYAWNNSTGFGTKYADGGASGINGGDVAWAA